MKTAIELIAAERNRQIEVEGYTPEHDDEGVMWLKSEEDKPISNPKITN